MKRLKILVVLLFVISLVASITASAVSADRYMSAQYGGNIYNAGTVNMSGGSIWGGVSEQGGNIYNAGRLIISGAAKVFDGLSRLFGGNVFNDTSAFFTNTGNIFFTDKEGSGIVTEDAGKCICGGLNGHLAGCDGAEQNWSMWTKTDSLPVDSGYYKLSNNVHIATYANANKSADIYLDLNGYTVTLADEGTRIYHVSQANTNVNITILDSVGTGKIDLGSGTGSGKLTALRDTGSGKKSFTIYGGTIDGFRLTGGANEGAVIRSLENATVNIHGGTVIGAGTSTKDGGAIYSKNKLIMTGGTVTGGSAVNGGNIMVASGEFNMTGGKIMNGYASGYGDNVYVDKANGATMTVAITGDSGFYLSDSNNNGIYPTVNIACDCRSNTDSHETGCNGTRYCTGFDFGIPTSDQVAVDALEYVRVNDVDNTYLTEVTSDGYYMVNALAPQFSIGGEINTENTSGVSVRFATDATDFCIRVNVTNAAVPMAHQHGMGVYGIDVYIGSGTDRYEYDCDTGQLMSSTTQILEIIDDLPSGNKEVQINLPLFAGVTSVEVGFKDGAKVAAPTERAYDDIVFYGSAVTQGNSASRPGTAYANILGLVLNANVRNLSYVDGGMGTVAAAQRIATLDGIGAFVMDYNDSNTVAGLEQTHYAFYQAIRLAHKDLPIILLTSPVYRASESTVQAQRTAIIQQTYDKAIADGDTNIYLISGEDYFPDNYADLYTENMVHANDLGMYNIAKTIYPVLKAMLDGTEIPEVKAPADTDFDAPVNSEQDLSMLNYVSIESIASSYQKGVLNGYNMISALAPQFAIGGCEHPNDNDGRLYRLDRSNMSNYSPKNATLAANTSGISIRFCTDASEIYVDLDAYNVKTTLSNGTCASSTYGIDVYVGTGTNRTLYAVVTGSETEEIGSDSGGRIIPINQVIALPEGYKEVMIELPLYAGARNVQIGFPDGAKVALPTERTYDDIVIYGPSIAQGASAGRPGLAYANIFGRMLNANVRNLGFSESALGEQVIAEYIANIDNISAFIMDYDHNNSTIGLQNTHYDFYKTVREAHKDIPIIILSRPVYLTEPNSDHHIRVGIIKDTYERALAEGDNNVYFIQGDDFFADDYPDLNSVDTVHPNDLGMYYTAKAVYPLLKQVLDAN